VQHLSGEPAKEGVAADLAQRRIDEWMQPSGAEKDG
jgi:hypothetical protein